jgi:putative hemolysin
MNAHPSAAATPHQPKQVASYQARLAHSTRDIQAAQALRFDVFNLELDEGLVQSYDTGLDVDAFDAQFAHLIVEDTASGAVVGTYRLQTGLRAREGLGYYSEREFDFTPFEAQRAQIVELGRACIHQQHRNFAVLNLLWKGIFSYAHAQGARYVMGCSSLTSQDAATGMAAYRHLAPHLAPAPWLTVPHAAFACGDNQAVVAAPKIPRLLSAYLTIGAALCGPPALDREFKTIDFLTWLDIDSPTLLAMQQRGRFVG